MDRRTLLAGAAAAMLPLRLPAQDRGQVVVVGGGFGGATAARFLALAGHDVTLVERETRYVTCPFSNTVIGGFADLPDLTFGYDGLGAAGVTVVQGEAVGVEDGTVALASGEALPWDRMVLAPGIDLHWDGLPGYDEAAAEIMPHAWKAGPQTALLRDQLRAMDDGGLVVIAAPANPFRCPPGPYERASLIAHYLKAEKPASKIVILDAKETFSKRALFEEAWAALYPGLIEWVPVDLGGKVVEVDPAGRTLMTDFMSYEADVANVIPPQRAGAIAVTAGVADETGWCPVDGATFESTLRPGIHVLGDACFAGAMPKSAFSANAQGKVAAQAIDAAFRGETAPAPKLLNTCYSLAAPDWGFTVAGVYETQGDKLAEIEGAGGTSPLGAPEAVRQAEAGYAQSWYATITAETFARG